MIVSRTLGTNKKSYKVDAYARGSPSPAHDTARAARRALLRPLPPALSLWDRFFLLFFLPAFLVFFLLFFLPAFLVFFSVFFPSFSAFLSSFSLSSSAFTLAWHLLRQTFSASLASSSFFLSSRFFLFSLLSVLLGLLVLLFLVLF